MPQTKRLAWVDIAKGLAIAAVVLFHIEFAYPNSVLFPFSSFFGEYWHVAIFFLIAGFFIKEEKLQDCKKFIIGKVKSLYLLILYIYIPVTLLHNLFLKIGFYSTSIDYCGKYVTEWSFADYAKHIAEAVFFAGREPLLGAMWFVYVLFLALCGYSVISMLLGKVFKEGKKYDGAKLVSMILLVVISCTLTQLLGITIPRGNNVLTAIFLIYVGQNIINRYHIEFNNPYAFASSILLLWHCCTCSNNIALNSNIFDNTPLLLAASVSALYAICFISKKIQDTKLGSLISIFGNESFYIMGLQFIAFKFVTLLLNLFGFDLNLAELKAPAGTSIMLCVLYFVAGMTLPVVLVKTLRAIKNKAIGNKQ